MAMLVGPSGRRRPAGGGLLLLAASLALWSVGVSALSVAPHTLRHRGSGRRASSSSAVPVHHPSSALFATPSASRRPSRPLPDFLSPVANGSVQSRRQNPVAAALSKVTQLMSTLRRPIIRAAIIVSLLLLGLKKGMIAPANAARSKTTNVVVVDATATTSSWCKKLTKVAVTGGAVAAGVATANRIRSSDSDDDGKIDIKENSVPEDKSPPLPLSQEWIEQELKETEKPRESPKPKSKPTPNKPNLPSSSDAMVKNLDSKIEMLRAREELAKATAEKQRQEDLAKAAEARKQEQNEIDAKISAFEQQQRLEQERVERIRKERAEREERLREEQLAKLEKVPSGKTAEGGAGKVIENLNLATGNVAEEGVVKGGAAEKDGSVDVETARRQPKSAEEERKLQEKYSKMELEERAFNILVDLGMVDLNPDPPSLDLSEDDDDAFM